MQTCVGLLFLLIPLFKINDLLLKDILVKYTNIDPPDESTLRKNYLPKCYEDTVQYIRTVCQDEKIWVCIDEMTLTLLGGKSEMSSLVF